MTKKYKIKKVSIWKAGRPGVASGYGKTPKLAHEAAEKQMAQRREWSGALNLQQRRIDELKQSIEIFRAKVLEENDLQRLKVEAEMLMASAKFEMGLAQREKRDAENYYATTTTALRKEITRLQAENKNLSSRLEFPQIG